VNEEEWRVEIDLDDEGHGYTLGERLRAHDLDDEARARLGRRVIVTRDGPRLFLYASDEEAAREAERVARELLDAERLTASIRITSWNPAAEEWLAPDLEGFLTAHPYEWEVHVDLPGRDEARELEERLAEEGLPAHRLWRWVTVESHTADEANEIADRVRGELGEGANVRVEPNPEGMPNPVFVWLETRV
jgi:DNA-binding transcriptional LysR family regulator